MFFRQWIVKLSRFLKAVYIDTFFFLRIRYLKGNSTQEQKNKLLQDFLILTKQLHAVHHHCLTRTPRHTDRCMDERTDKLINDYTWI